MINIYIIYYCFVKFLNLFIGHESIQKIECYCRRFQTSEVLLALYMQLLRRIAKHEGAAIFVSSLHFLAEFENILLNGSATLQQSFFGLISDLVSVEVKHSFKFGLTLAKNC